MSLGGIPAYAGMTGVGVGYDEEGGVPAYAGMTGGGVGYDGMGDSRLRGNDGRGCGRDEEGVCTWVRRRGTLGYS